MIARASVLRSRHLPTISYGVGGVLLLAGVVVSALMIYGVHQPWVSDGETGMQLSPGSDDLIWSAGAEVEIGSSLVLVGLVLAFLGMVRRHPGVLIPTAAVVAAGAGLAFSGVVDDARSAIGSYGGLTETGWMDLTNVGSIFLFGLAATMALTGCWCVLLAVRAWLNET